MWLNDISLGECWIDGGGRHFIVHGRTANPDNAVWLVEGALCYGGTHVAYRGEALSGLRRAPLPAEPSTVNGEPDPATPPKSGVDIVNDAIENAIACGRNRTAARFHVEKARETLGNEERVEREAVDNLRAARDTLRATVVEQIAAAEKRGYDKGFEAGHKLGCEETWQRAGKAKPADDDEGSTGDVT